MGLSVVIVLFETGDNYERNQRRNFSMSNKNKFWEIFVSISKESYSMGFELKSHNITKLIFTAKSTKTLPYIA